MANDFLEQEKKKIQEAIKAQGTGGNFVEQEKKKVQEAINKSNPTGGSDFFTQEKLKIEGAIGPNNPLGLKNTMGNTSVSTPQYVSRTSESPFRQIGKQLMKPVGMAGETLKTGSNVAGSLLLPAFTDKVSKTEAVKMAGGELVKGAKAVKEVATGKKETSIGEKVIEYAKGLDVLSKTQPSKLENFARGVISLGGDLVLDPLNKINLVKVSQAINKVIPLEKTATKLSTAIGKTAPAQVAKKIFSTSSGDIEFDRVVQKFRDLKEYREGILFDQAQNLQKDISKMGKWAEKAITEGLENPASLANATPEIQKTVSTLKTTYKTFLNKAREVGLKVGEIVDYAPHIRTKESFLNEAKNFFGMGAREWAKGSVEKGRRLTGTIEEMANSGLNIFEKNPAVQLVKKGQVFVKAITSKEFAQEAMKFADETGVEVANTLLKGMKFKPEVARVIDNFYQGIRPEELNVILKTFDKVQNWWKGQALLGPSYHVRNQVGNLWNNYLAGVNPAYYVKAGLAQTGKLADDTTKKVIQAAKEHGVINEGFFMADIPTAIENQVKKGTSFFKGVNPFSQENYLFRLNKKIGSGIENNARLAHFMDKLAEGFSPEEAAMSVKKYLFDYTDLTSIERNVFKRIAPFYTWTKKNIPLQLSELVKQPGKFTLPYKIIERLEQGVEIPDEKYMSEYIANNIPIRIRKNDKGTYDYFFLGQWLPYSSAIDFLSNPMDNIISQITPIIKAPVERFANKSLYFKDTLGNYSDIENYPGEQAEFGLPFVGSTLLSKKNINLLRNIRILNDMSKFVDKKDPTATDRSWTVKFLDYMFGKAATYDPKKSAYFYYKETEDRATEIKSAIKNALKKGFKDEAKKLNEELKNFLKERHAPSPYKIKPGDSSSGASTISSTPGTGTKTLTQKYNEDTATAMARDKSMTTPQQTMTGSTPMFNTTPEKPRSSEIEAEYWPKLVRGEKLNPAQQKEFDLALKQASSNVMGFTAPLKDVNKVVPKTYPVTKDNLKLSPIEVEHMKSDIAGKLDYFQTIKSNPNAKIQPRGGYTDSPVSKAIKNIDANDVDSPGQFMQKVYDIMKKYKLTSKDYMDSLRMTFHDPNMLYEVETSGDLPKQVVDKMWKSAREGMKKVKR